MKSLLFLLLVCSVNTFAQWKDYRLINDGKDTVNRIDQRDQKQGEWIVRFDHVRGEPGYEGFGWDLTIIDSLHWLGVTLIMGAIIGLWGV